MKRAVHDETPPVWAAAAEPAEPSRDESESLGELERRTIAAALARAKGNKSRAAAALGLTRMQLYTRLRRFGLTV